MEDDEARTLQGGNKEKIPECLVFTSHYSDLVNTLSGASLSDRFVSESIITITDSHTIESETDPNKQARLLLKPIAAALESRFTLSFYKMLGIMKDNGNESMRLLADKISQSNELRGSEFANTSISSSSLQDISTPTTTPAQIILQRRIIPTDCFNTPGEANVEFNVVLSNIVQELSAYISQNDQRLKSVCHFIIHKLLFLSQEDKDKIANSKSIIDIKHVMDPHWNWSSHRLLEIIIRNLRSTKSSEILQRFDRRINKQMKLKDIHQNLQPITQSSDYSKMIAILDLKKDYSEITLEEGLEIEEFVVEYLEQIGAHTSKAYECTPPCIEMEWNISTAAVDDFCGEAMKHKDVFIGRSFLCLTIGNYTIFNDLPNKAGKPRVPRSSLMMVFNDPIHGHIELDPVLLKIIDTPQFQRLRYIKQLGGGYYVFPGASHNRFEHSIGVCYLAGELVETLKMKQPELGITKDDVFCVKMAGLCNNLGCGPFSDMFEKSFIPKARKDRKNWKHQEASVKMLDHLIEQNDLTNVFKPKDLEFVKELILCPPIKNWAATGRNKDKEFLYEIVTNKRNGIDVNKWDFLARDCYHLGITSIFDHRRFMMFARVIECDGKHQICSRDKEVMNLYDMFYTRYLLHKRAYYHKTVNAVELMICEALLNADSQVLKKSKIKLSECIDDMRYYTELTDHVFHQILLSTSPSMKKSKEILNKVVKRELYKYIGYTQPTSKTTFTEEELAEQIVKYAKKDLTTDDLAVKIVTFDYGMEEKNPIDHVRFYAKDYPNQAFQLRKDHVSRVMLLKEFVEQEISVYCKKRDDNSLKAAQTAFANWCNKAGYAISSDSDFDDIYTPYRIPPKSSQDFDKSNLKPSEPKKQRMDQ